MMGQPICQQQTMIMCNVYYELYGGNNNSALTKCLLFSLLLSLNTTHPLSDVVRVYASTETAPKSRFVVHTIGGQKWVCVCMCWLVGVYVIIARMRCALTHIKYVRACVKKAAAQCGACAGRSINHGEVNLVVRDTTTARRLIHTQTHTHLWSIMSVRVRCVILWDGGQQTRSRQRRACCFIVPCDRAIGVE